MAEIRQEETQKDFFEFSGEAKRAERFPSIQKTQKPILFYTSIEQILLAGILIVLAMCFVFFLGVLRGRAVAVQPRQAVAVISASAPAVLRPNIQTAPENKTAVTSARNVVASVAPNNPYTIQLASYKKRDFAETEAAQLRRGGYSSSVFASGDYFVVCVGQYGNKDAAQKDLSSLSSKYQRPFLRRRQVQS